MKKVECETNYLESVWKVESTPCFFRNHASGVGKEVEFDLDKATLVSSEYNAGFEAKLNLIDHRLIVDIDASRSAKREKLTVCDLNVVPAFVAGFKERIYAECTFNQGFHLLLACKGPLTFVQDRFKSNDDKIVLELKKQCLMFPSSGYTPLQAPQNVVPFSFDEVIDFMTRLSAVLKITNVDWRKVLHAGVEPSVSAIKIVPKKSKNLPNISDALKILTTSSAQFNEDTDQDDDVTRPSKRTRPEDGFDDEIGFDVSPQFNSSSETSNGSRGRRKSAASSSTAGSTLNLTSTNQKNLNLITRLTENLSRARVIGETSENDRTEEENLAEFEREKNQVQQFLLNLNEKYQQSENEKCLPEEIENKSKLLTLYEEIIANILPQDRAAEGNSRLNLLAGSDSLVSGFQSSILKLNAHMFQLAQNHKMRMFGEDIRAFIEFILRADYKFFDDGSRIMTEKIREKILLHGVFSRLSAGYLWRQWLHQYCRLVITLERVQHYNGLNSQTNAFKDYELYRLITLRNSEGANMHEEIALDEYLQFKRRVANKYNNFYLNIWHVFFTFILTTLATAYISPDLLHFFAIYADYFVNLSKPTEDVNFHFERLIFIKLFDFDFRISFVRKEVDTNKFSNVAVFYFKHYPWVSVCDEWFKNFLQKCFPNFTRFDELIYKINNQEKVHIGHRFVAVDNVTSLQFKSWANIMPWQNVLLDFRFFNELFSDFSKNVEEIVDTSNLKHYASWPLQKNRKEKACDISLAAEKLVKKIRNLEAVRACGKEEELRSFLKYMYNIDVPSEYFSRFQSFSLFRNYIHTDRVITPIKLTFSVADYLGCYFNQKCPLLSLDNEARYSSEFCCYMRSLFGNDSIEGKMGPFQYTRMFATMVVIAQALLRNKVLQICLNLIGKGRNGKSLLLTMLKHSFPDKFANITVKQFFNNSNETQQQAVGHEENCVVFDPEGDTVDLAGFKTYVADADVPQIRRMLYRTINREVKNLCSVIVCSNYPLRYVSPILNRHAYDGAFDRRMMVIPFYNLLGGKTLFSERNFNIQAPEVMQKLKRGIIWFILDIIHVFDLANIDASLSDYIKNTPANRRTTCRANNDLANKFFERYICIDECQDFGVEPHVVNLKSFLASTVSKRAPADNIAKDEALNSLSEALRCVDVEVTRQVSCDISMFDDMSTNETLDYLAKNVYPRSSMSLEMELQWANPNFLHKLGPEPAEDTFQAYERHVASNIAPGHRFIFNNIHFGKQFYKSISHILRGKMYDPLQMPICDPNWIDTTLDDFLASI